MPEIQPQFNLQSVLARTPDEIKEDLEMQEDAKKRLSAFLPDSPEKATYLHALGMEETARQNIDSVAGAGKTNGANDILQGALNLYQSKLADALFWQGKFSEAAENDPREQQRLEYQQYAEAFEALDAPFCDCVMRVPDGKSAKGTTYQPKRVIQKVFVGSINKIVIFTRCEKCARIFATSS